METRSQSRSKLPSATDAAVLDATEMAASAAPKSALAARLEKREAMKRSSMNTNVGDPESDLSDDCAEGVNGRGENGHGESDDDGEELEGEVEDLKEEDMYVHSLFLWIRIFLCSRL